MPRQENKSRPITSELVRDVLNEAFRRDPAAMHALIINRAPCNEQLADDPHVVVDDHLSAEGGVYFSVGMMGVLNGILNAAQQPLVAYKFSTPDEKGRTKFLGFTEYKPNKS